MKERKNGLTREQAAQLYDDLKRAVTSMKKKTGGASGGATARATTSKAAGMAQYLRGNSARTREVPEDLALDPALARLAKAPFDSKGRGQMVALVAVVGFAAGQLILSGMELAGVPAVAGAEASIHMMAPVSPKSEGNYSREEVAILTSLDGRRTELEERSKRLEQRETDLDLRDKEFAARLTQVRELTEQLKLDRDKTEKRRNVQIEQLANVYGSMNPPDAAALIEQLDSTIALALLEHMPEKRIAQVLALMKPEHALQLTKMLTVKGS